MRRPHSFRDTTDTPVSRAFTRYDSAPVMPVELSVRGIGTALLNAKNESGCTPGEMRAGPSAYRVKLRPWFEEQTGTRHTFGVNHLEFMGVLIIPDDTVAENEIEIWSRNRERLLGVMQIEP